MTNDQDQPTFEGPVELAIDGELDLHTFHPSDLSPLLKDYMEACHAKGILSLRIIHGKGRGVLRERVHAQLKKHPLVKGFRLAPPESGGWGATLVELKGPGSSPDFSG